MIKRIFTINILHHVPYGWSSSIANTLTSTQLWCGKVESLGTQYLSGHVVFWSILHGLKCSRRHAININIVEIYLLPLVYRNVKLIGYCNNSNLSWNIITRKFKPDRSYSIKILIWNGKLSSKPIIVENLAENNFGLYQLIQ